MGAGTAGGLSHQFGDSAHFVPDHFKLGSIGRIAGLKFNLSQSIAGRLIDHGEPSGCVYFWMMVMLMGEIPVCS